MKTTKQFVSSVYKSCFSFVLYENNFYSQFLSKELWFRWKDLDMLYIFILQVIPWIKFLVLKINQPSLVGLSGLSDSLQTEKSLVRF